MQTAGNVVAREKIGHLICIPAWVPELNDVANPLGKDLQKVLQSSTVDLEVRRQLVEHRAETTPQRLHPAEQACDRLLRILELFHVGQVSTRLDRVDEI